MSICMARFRETMTPLMRCNALVPKTPTDTGRRSQQQQQQRQRPVMPMVVTAMLNADFGQLYVRQFDRSVRRSVSLQSARSAGRMTSSVDGGSE